MCACVSESQNMKFEANRTPISTRNAQNRKVTFFCNGILRFSWGPKIWQRCMYDKMDCAGDISKIHISGSNSRQIHANGIAIEGNVLKACTR